MVSFSVSSWLAVAIHVMKVRGFLDTPVWDPVSTDTTPVLTAQSPAITQAPKNLDSVQPHQYLFARQETRTCGYFDGDGSRPNLCGVNSYCIFVSDHFGCYGGVGASYTPTVCVTGTVGPVVDPNNGDTVTCPNACQTTYFPSVEGATAGTGPFTHVDCAETSAEPLTLQQEATESAEGASPTTSQTLSSPTTNSVRVSVSLSVYTKTIVQPASSVETATDSPTQSAEPQATETPSNVASLQIAGFGGFWGLVLCLGAMVWRAW